MLISSFKLQIACSNVKYHFFKMAKQLQGKCSSLFVKEQFPKVIIHLLTAKGIVHSIYLNNTGSEARQINFDSCQNFFRIPTKLSCYGHVDGALVMVGKGARHEEKI